MKVFENDSKQRNLLDFYFGNDVLPEPEFIGFMGFEGLKTVFPATRLVNGVF